MQCKLKSGPGPAMAAVDLACSPKWVRLKLHIAGEQEQATRQGSISLTLADDVGTYHRAGCWGRGSIILGIDGLAWTQEDCMLVIV